MLTFQPSELKMLV